MPEFPDFLKWKTIKSLNNSRVSKRIEYLRLVSCHDPQDEVSKSNEQVAENEKLAAATPRSCFLFSASSSITA